MVRTLLVTVEQVAGLRASKSKYLLARSLDLRSAAASDKARQNGRRQTD